MDTLPVAELYLLVPPADTFISWAKQQPLLETLHLLAVLIDTVLFFFWLFLWSLPALCQVVMGDKESWRIL